MQQAMIAGFSRHHPAMATAVVSPKPAWWRYVRHEQARIVGHGVSTDRRPARGARGKPPSSWVQ
jgi:hypothetical protein